jgi:membrane-bound serine protease (ClpP class)
VAFLTALLLAIFVVPTPWGIPLVAAGGLVEVAESLLLWRWSRRRRPAVGPETLVGAEGVVTRDGLVRVQGELWRAVAERPLVPGQRVRVEAVEGLTLRVREA